jgi:hypothetical protein
MVKISKFEKCQLKIGIFQTAILTVTLICAVYIGVKQNSINQSLLNLNYVPSIMITYENNRINFKNMGSQNIWLWGKKVGSRKPLIEEKPVLLTLGGLYFIDGKKIAEISAFEKQSDLKMQIPVEFYFQTENHERYVFNNIFYYNNTGGNRHLCHLKKGQPTYVAIWQVVDKQIHLVEVSYVGTHEKAPY